MPNVRSVEMASMRVQKFAQKLSQMAIKISIQSNFPGRSQLEIAGNRARLTDADSGYLVVPYARDGEVQFLVFDAEWHRLFCA